MLLLIYIYNKNINKLILSHLDKKCNKRHFWTKKKTSNLKLEVGDYDKKFYPFFVPDINNFRKKIKILLFF